MPRIMLSLAVTKNSAFVRFLQMDDWQILAQDSVVGRAVAYARENNFAYARVTFGGR